MFGKDKKRLSTLEEVRKAYEDLSEEDKKTFRQTFSDRVDESLGEQKKDAGQEDEQTAKDRVDESLGEEKADKKAENERNSSETDENAAENKQKDEDESDDAEKKQVFILDRIADLLEKLVAQHAEKSESKDDNKLKESERKYATGLSGGYAGEKGGDKYTEADTERFLRNR